MFMAFAVIHPLVLFTELLYEARSKRNDAKQDDPLMLFYWHQ
jgi:hypothetical protein